MEGYEWSLVIFGGLACAYFMIDFLGLIELPLSFVFWAIILTSFVSTETILLGLKKGTPKLIAYNFHTTTDGLRIAAGDYSMFVMGCICQKPFNYPGTEGTFICLTESINRLGTEIACTVTPSIVNKHFLPHEVIEKIDEYKLPAPYHLGVLSEKQELTEADSSRLASLLQQKNDYVNTLLDVIKGKTGAMEQVIEVHGRISKKNDEINKPSWFDRIRKKREPEYERRDER